MIWYVWCFEHKVKNDGKNSIIPSPRGWGKTYEEVMSLPESKMSCYKLYKLTKVKNAK